MADVMYKLPLDPELDKDLIDWINSFPRNKKAEVVRHALRFYKSHLKEGETFIMPSGNSEGTLQIPVETKSEKPKIGIKKKAPIGDLKNRLMNPE